MDMSKTTNANAGRKGGVFDQVGARGTPEQQAGQKQAGIASGGVSGGGLGVGIVDKPSDGVKSSAMSVTAGNLPAGMTQEDYVADVASKINSSSPSVEKDLKELDKFSDEDIEIAQQIIFRGYAEKGYPMKALGNTIFTVCSTNADEMTIMDEIVFDELKLRENDKGEYDVPQNYVQSKRNSVYVALSYVGMSGKDLCETPSLQLATIKKAIARCTELYNSGEIEKAGKLRVEIKKSVKARAARVSGMPTPLIDFLSSRKVEFDTTVMKIMNSEGIIPKS